MVNGGTNMFDKSFQEITNNIKNMVSKTQLDIMLDANSKLINLYYNIGKTISDNYEWGNKFIDNLALELKLSFPNLKGFSVRNLKYMKMLRNDIIENFVFIDITYTLDDDTFNTTDVYIADYYLGTISNDTEDQRVKEDQIKVNIESQLVNGVMLEDIKNLYKSYN